MEQPLISVMQVWAFIQLCLFMRGLKFKCI